MILQSESYLYVKALYVFIEPVHFSGLNLTLSNRNYLLLYFKSTHPSVRFADVPPLSRERGEKHRRCEGVSQGKGTNQNTTLFHSHYLIKK